MYLAEKTVRGKKHFCLRESFAEDGKFIYKELFDLGADPRAFIVYSGGVSFYFEQELVDALVKQGCNDADRDLERLLMPFLKADVRRIISQTTKLGRRQKRDLSRSAMLKAQKKLHLFDRRRLYYLRFGRMDSLQSIMKPHKFYNSLLDKSRDELEFYLRSMEPNLRLRERKNYVYAALDLARYFPGDFARLFPAGISEEKLDDAFLEEVCRLNSDPSYIDFSEQKARHKDVLSEYLKHYAVMWFDYEFGQRSPENHIFDEFIRSRRQYRAPEPSPKDSVSLNQACKLFCISREEWAGMPKSELMKKYRKMAKERHPDQGGDDESFIELNQAYEKLIENKS